MTTDGTTQPPTMWQTVDALDKGMIRIWVRPSRMVQYSLIATQNGTWLNTDKLLISGIFHLMFSDYSWPWETETKENQTAEKRTMVPRSIELYALNGGMVWYVNHIQYSY